MAPTPELTFFPPLDRCLSKSDLLLSWRAAYHGLCDAESSTHTDARLEQILSEQYPISLLSRPFTAPRPTPQSKQAFDTRTASINTSETGGKASWTEDLKQIKEDALWLSKKVAIDEVSALRIVTLHWQIQSVSRLSEGLSREEAASVKAALGQRTLQIHLRMAQDDFDNSNQLPEKGDQLRKYQILQLCLSEKRSMLQVSNHLVRIGLLPSSAQYGPRSSGPASHTWTWARRIGRTILNARMMDDDEASQNRTFIVNCVESLEDRVEALQKPCPWAGEFADKENVERDWQEHLLHEMNGILNLIFVLLDAKNSLPATSNLLSWFRFASKCGFFNTFSLLPVDPSLVNTLQSLCSIISLEALKLANSLDHVLSLDISSTRSLAYVTEAHVMDELNKCFIGAIQAGSALMAPSIFAWSMILQTMREKSLLAQEANELRQSQIAAEGFSEADSSGTEGRESPSPQPELTGVGAPPDDILAGILDTLLASVDTDDLITLFANCAVNDLRVLSVVSQLALRDDTWWTAVGALPDHVRVRMALLHLLRAGISFVEYSPDVVESLLAVLDGAPSADREHFISGAEINEDLDPVAFFWSDDHLRRKFLDVARYRFPYELAPFLRLAKSLAAYNVSDEEGIIPILGYLENLPTLTQVMQPAFQDYALLEEDENVNMIVLTRPLEQFPNHNGYGKRMDSKGLSLARVKSSPSDLIIPTGTEGKIVSDSHPLVTMWTYKYSGLCYLGKVLETFTSGASFEAIGETAEDEIADIISLLAHLLHSSWKESTLPEGVHSSDVPQKILEEASDGVSRNRDIISIVFDVFEQVLQREQRTSTSSTDEILIACIQFINVLTPVLPGRIWPLIGRCGLLDISGQGGKFLSIVSAAAISQGRYDFLLECLSLYEALIEDALAGSIARRTSSKPSSRFGANPAAQSMSTGVSEAAIIQILLSFTQATVEVFERFTEWKYAEPKDRYQIGSKLSLIFSKIVTYSYGVDDLNPLDKKITAALSSSAKYLVDIFLSSSENDLAIQPFLDTLLENVWSFAELSQQGNQLTSRILTLLKVLVKLRVLIKLPITYLESQLLKSLPLVVRLYSREHSHRAEIAQLLDALIVAANQTESEPASLFGHLSSQTAKDFFDLLSDIDRPLENPELSSTIWRFFSSVMSQRQQWFAVYLLTGETPRSAAKAEGPLKSSSKSLFTVALDTLSHLESLNQKLALSIFDFVVAAQDYWPWAVTDVHRHPDFLHAILEYISHVDDLTEETNQEKILDTSFKVKIAASIAETLAIYLHNAKQLGIKPDMPRILPKLGFFVKNATEPPLLNRSLHANLRKNFGNKFSGLNILMFKRTSLDKRPFGRDFLYNLEVAQKVLGFEQSWKNSRSQGFAAEFVRANINFSLVEAQITLLRGWKLLALELCQLLDQQQVLHQQLAKVVNSALKSNISVDLPETIFGQQVELRADLAFWIMQRLVSAKSTDPEVHNVLSTAWSCFQYSNGDLPIALSSDNGNYHRTLFKIILLALESYRYQAPSKEGSPAWVPDVQLVLEVTGVLVARGFKDLVAAIHEKASECLPEDIGLMNSILQAVLKLPGIDGEYTRLSSKFIEEDSCRAAISLFSWSERLAINGDPIYGELSLSFLTELSVIPAMAEQLGVDGILGLLSNTSLVGHIAGGVSAMKQPRLYAIWAQGILPLLLNLLAAIGPAVAADVTMFLNQMSEQTERHIASWDSTEGISTAMASAAHSLALLSFVLENFADNHGGPGESIPKLALDRDQLRERLDYMLGRKKLLSSRVVAISPDETEMHRKPVAGGSSNLLVQRVTEEIEAALQILTSPAVEDN